MNTASTIHPQLTVTDWGTTRYADALDRQLKTLAARIRGEIEDRLIFTEHDPVYTTGIRDEKAMANLLLSKTELAARGIDFHTTRRGGDITFHGHGQVIGYPIISLRKRMDLHAYLRDLEEVIIQAIARWGLTGHRREGLTGVWLDKRKICAMGIGVKSWVTYHGFALNVNPDLDFFNGIVPCGITDGSVTSMEMELGKPVNRSEVLRVITSAFIDRFYS